jgi:hypothetical protein
MISPDRMKRALLLAALLNPTLGVADSLCPDSKGERESDAQFAKAQQAEKAGRWAEAYDAASRALTDCARSPNEVTALKHRTARKLGQAAEQKQDLEGAFGWYQSAEALADADRIKLAQAKKRPEDVGVMSNAIDWFKRRGNQPSLGEVRAIAARNAEKAFAAEEKAFAGFGHDSLDQLGKARSWLGYAAAGEQRALARAEQRGDTLSADDTRASLGLALRYYQAAGKEEKRKSVREKARRLGEAHATKGEASVAADFFAIAGDEARAGKTREAGHAKDEKAEQNRQKTFEKDQSKLEKELGL